MVRRLYPQAAVNGGMISKGVDVRCQTAVTQFCPRDKLTSISTRQPCMAEQPQSKSLPSPLIVSLSVTGLSRNDPMAEEVKTAMGKTPKDILNILVGKSYTARRRRWGDCLPAERDRPPQQCTP